MACYLAMHATSISISMLNNIIIQSEIPIVYKRTWNKAQLFKHISICQVKASYPVQCNYKLSLLAVKTEEMAELASVSAPRGLSK